jgi:hypothetical protein
MKVVIPAHPTQVNISARTRHLGGFFIARSKERFDYEAQINIENIG